MSEHLALPASQIAKKSRATAQTALVGLLALALAGCSVDSGDDESVGSVANDLAADADANAHLLVLVRSDGGAFSVVGSRRVDGPLPKRRGQTKQAGWSFRASDLAGAPTQQGIVDNPHTLRGDFKDPLSGATSGVAITRGEAATFALRVPLGTNLLEFFDQVLPADTAAAAAAPQRGAAVAANTPAGAVRLGSVTLP